MFRENTQEMFCYLEHRTTDFKFNIIKDAYVTLENAHDSVPYLSRLVRRIEQLGFKVEASALDSGYLTSAINEDRLGSYSIVTISPGELYLSLLKSIILYFLL